MADIYPPEGPMIERPRSPWRLIFRAVAVASNPRSILLAALGLAALVAGWSGIAQVMGPAPWLDRASPGPWGMGVAPDQLIGGVLKPALGLVGPFVAMFRPDVSAMGRLSAVLASLWALLVWGVFGGAIARIAVVRVARNGNVGLVPALRFSLARLGSLVAAPIAPLLVAMLIGVAGVAVGLLDRLPSPIGPSAATILAFVPLVVGLLDAVILLGLALAWPLMIATVVAEGEDFFDAVSRSYSYVNQRTVPYVGYLLLAVVAGAVGLAAVGLFIFAALGLADWSVSLGAPTGGGFRFLDPSSADRSGLPALAHVWTGAVEMLAAGWIYSYLWSTAAILYLVLRRDIDGAEVRDIYEPSHEADPFVPDDPGETAPIDDAKTPD